VNQINDGKMKTQPAQPPSGRIAHQMIAYLMIACFL
jgi:hypothetical protein